jgi:hypothetical protein
MTRAPTRSLHEELDDPRQGFPAGRGSAPCYIEFHKDDDVNQRRRNERRELPSSGMMISTELAEPASQVLARSLVSGPGS